MTRNTSGGARRNWMAMVAAAAACFMFALTTYGLFAGWADHHDGHFEHTMPLDRISVAPLSDDDMSPMQPLERWSVTKTPQGRPAVFKSTATGRVFGMFQETDDARYFTGRVVNTRCTTERKGEYETTFVTVMGGDPERKMRQARRDPWFDRIAQRQCDGLMPHRVMASTSAVMEWMMHIVPGERYALQQHSTTEKPGIVEDDVPAYRLVMGNS